MVVDDARARVERVEGERGRPVADLDEGGVVMLAPLFDLEKRVLV